MLANRSRLTIICVLLLAIVFRLFLVPVARHGDINNNMSWGNELLMRGTDGFYEGKEWPFSAPNQPPLYLYVFAGVALVQTTITSTIAFLNAQLPAFPSPLVWWWDLWGELYMAKFPGIIADIGIAVVIYKIFGKKWRWGVGLAALWLASPVSWYNSAVWGGTDSIVNLLGLLSILLILRKKLVYATVLFLFSILFKSSLLLFAPLFLLIVVQQKYAIQEFFRSLLISFAVVILVSAPFHASADAPLWLFNLYIQRFLPGEVGSLSANAFNFWWIVDSGPTLDTRVYFGLSARMWGILVTLLGYLASIGYLRKKLDPRKAILSFATIALIAFLFMTRIHERYMFPFFPLATIALASFRWLWLPYVVLSATHVLNLYHLFWAPGIPAIEALYTNPLFAIVLSIINVICGLYIIVRLNKSL